MASIYNPATGLMTEIPDAEDTVVVNQSPAESVNTEDRIASSRFISAADAQARVNSTKLSPLPKLNPYDNTVTSVVIADTVTVTAPRQYPVNNPLLDYDSYTYSLSLHGCSIEDYNNLVDNPNGFVPKQVLIAGAGRYSDTFPRNTYFQNTDFFFENLRMTSYINTTSRNRFSNLIECNFTIIEPLGFTLIKRIMSACMAPDGGINSPNYLKQPFILQIDFFGYKDGNEVRQFDSLADAFGDDTKTAPSLKDHTKFLPIIFTEVKSRVTTKGTEYQISAAPYNHMAFSPTKVVTPADFSVKAATVQDIFGKSFEIPSELVESSQREQADIAAGRDLDDAFGPGTVVNQTGFSNTFIDAGLCDKLNAWNIALKEKTGRLPNKFRVEFDPVIGASSIEPGQLADVSTVAEGDKSAKNSTQQAAGQKKSVINFKNQTVNIPAGTNIGAVIEWAILNSQWFQETNIYNDATAGSDKGKIEQDQRKAILNAFKIIPKIKVTEYDPGRADYSYEVVFYVKRWLANSKATNAAQGRTPGWVKEYNYFYSGGARSLATGQFTDNKDIIDLQIEFNTLYYTQLTAFKDKLKFQNTGAGTNLNTADVPEQTTAYSGSAVTLPRENQSRPKTQDGNNGPRSTSDALTNFSVEYVSKDARNNVAKGSNSAARVAAADILNTQLIDFAHGDMINVKLRIIGDPTFIKQDDIFYNSGISYATDLLTKNNSLRTDDSELYVFITFRTPEDYDESTGLAIPGQNKFAYTEFTGVYKIITIDNQFTKGKFEQVLDLVRLTTSDEKLEVEVINSDRIESLLLSGAGQTNRFPSTLPFGTRIIQSGFSGGNINNLVSQSVGQFTNQIITNISTEVNSALTAIGNSISDTLTGVFGTENITALGELGNTLGAGFDLVNDVRNINPESFVTAALNGSFNNLNTALGSIELPTLSSLPSFDIGQFNVGSIFS
jgi:hypothetical protein